MLTTGVIAALIAFSGLLLSAVGMGIKITLWMAEIRGDVKELKKDFAEDHRQVKTIPVLDHRLRTVEHRLAMTSAPYRGYTKGAPNEEEEQ